MIALILAACTFPEPQPPEPDFALLAVNCRRTKDLETCYRLGDAPVQDAAAFGLTVACTSNFKDSCRRGFELDERRGTHMNAVFMANRGCKNGDAAMCQRLLRYGERHPEAAEMVERYRLQTEARLSELEAAAP